MHPDKGGGMADVVHVRGSSGACWLQVAIHPSFSLCSFSPKAVAIGSRVRNEETLSIFLPEPEESGYQEFSLPGSVMRSVKQIWPSVGNQKGTAIPKSPKDDPNERQATEANNCPFHLSFDSVTAMTAAGARVARARKLLGF